MPPVLGVPPPPPPAPHIGPDGFILPRKLLNPCLQSANHQDLHRELRFNQKMYVIHTSLQRKEKENEN